MQNQFQVNHIDNKHYFYVLQNYKKINNEFL